MHVRRLLACLALTAALAIGGSSTASAAGTAYKMAFSFNCDNPSVCLDPAVAGALGGDWGSIWLYADGTGKAEFTSATHQTPGLPTGATHYVFVLAWSALSSPSGPPPGAALSDPNGGYLVLNVVNVPGVAPLITPATPGHYKFQGAMFGMPAVNLMLQINAA